MWRVMLVGACVVGLLSLDALAANYVPLSVTLDGKTGATHQSKAGALSGADQLLVSETYFSYWSMQDFTATALAQSTLTDTSITLHAKTGGPGQYNDMNGEDPRATATVVFRLGAGAQLTWSGAPGISYWDSIGLTGPDGKGVILDVLEPMPVPAGDYTFWVSAWMGPDHSMSAYGDTEGTLQIVPEPGGMVAVLAGAIPVLLRRARRRAGV